MILRRSLKLQADTAKDHKRPQRSITQDHCVGCVAQWLPAFVAWTKLTHVGPGYSTWMGDRLRAGILSRCVKSQLGQLSLASLQGRLIEYQLRLGWGRECHLCRVAGRGVVVRERGGTPFRQIFWSRNGTSANIVGHRWNANTEAFRQITSYSLGWLSISLFSGPNCPQTRDLASKIY